MVSCRRNEKDIEMSNLFSSPKMPAPLPAATVMPTADSASVRRARRKSIAEQKRRGGRQSTILTDEKLGG